MNSDFVVAVHGLVYLNHKGCIASSEELAKNICTNPARVRKVMAKMKKLKLISTKEGTEGGYCPQKKLGQTTLADIAKALDSKVVELKWHSGCDDMKCLVSSGMASVMDEIFTQLDENCKARLNKITIKQLEKQLFLKKS